MHLTSFHRFSIIFYNILALQLSDIHPITGNTCTHTACSDPSSGRFNRVLHGKTIQLFKSLPALAAAPEHRAPPTVEATANVKRAIADQMSDIGGGDSDLPPSDPDPTIHEGDSTSPDPESNDHTLGGGDRTPVDASIGDEAGPTSGGSATGGNEEWGGSTPTLVGSNAGDNNEPGAKPHGQSKPPYESHGSQCKVIPTLAPHLLTVPYH